MPFSFVPDTNVVLAAAKSSKSGSPNREILEAWRDGKCQLLFSRDTGMEYVEKLLHMGWSPEAVVSWLARLELLGESVEILWFHLRLYPSDPDDIAFLLCALNGNASHLVTYDLHLLTLASHYAPELKICPPLEFLKDFRGTE